MYEPRVFLVLDRESKRQLVTPEDDADYIDDYSDANLLDDLCNINVEEISVEMNIFVLRTQRQAQRCKYVKVL